MADGRDVAVWDNHAHQCREAKRELFEFPTNEESTGGWLRSRVLEVLEPGSQVLDLGCGPGYWRKLFEGMDYTGFDQSLEMLALAKEFTDNSHWVQGNARSVDASFSAGNFSMVFMASVLQHNRHEPDKREIVQAVHKILKDGGYFLLTENTFREHNCPQATTNPDFTDGYSFTPKGWDDFLLPLGFKRVAYNGQSEYLYQKI
jgi:SAM-dependent methyltransferase